MNDFLLSLTHSVAPVRCLFVIVRVVVDIVKDDHIGCCQVDAQASCTRGQQKHKYVFVAVEFVYHLQSEKERKMDKDG